MTILDAHRKRAAAILAAPEPPTQQADVGNFVPFSVATPKTQLGVDNFGRAFASFAKSKLWPRNTPEREAELNAICSECPHTEAGTGDLAGESFCRRCPCSMHNEAAIAVKNRSSGATCWDDPPRF